MRRKKKFEEDNSDKNNSINMGGHQSKTYAANILKEIKDHKELLFCPQSDADEGSDSNPSEDNLDVKEIIKILPPEVVNSENTIEKLPTEPKEEDKKIEIPKKNSAKPIIKTSYMTIKSNQSARPKIDQKRDNLRSKNTNLHNQSRHNNNIVQYIEMVDNWTQTSIHEDQYFFIHLFKK